MSLLRLVLIIFYFNVITFGNGPVMVPLLQRRLVDEAQVLTLGQLLYAFAIARVTPGQANTYVAAVGYFLHGLPGAILTTLAIQLPGYLMLPIMRLYQRFRRFEPVRQFIRGITATSVGLILAATLSIGRDTLTSFTGIVVFGLAFVMAYVLKWDQILSMVLAALVGLVLHFVL